jgi:hypothetical protein
MRIVAPDRNVLSRRITYLFPCVVAVLWAAGAGVAAKLHGLATGAYPPGARIAITTREFNDYLQAEIPNTIGPGVRNARVETGNGGIVRGYADVDFLKLRQASGQKPNWLMAELLSGERPVEITVQVISGHGKCRVDVLRAEVSGIVVEGRTLDFLINNFVIPSFPDVKVGKEFLLGYNIERLEIRPGVATVVLRNG